MLEGELSIRAHHLDMWGSMVSKYLEFPQGKRPWETPASGFFETLKFVKQYTEEEVNMDVRVRKLLESSAITNSMMRRDFRYVCDLVGLSKDSEQKTLLGRNNYFLGIFEAASCDKNNRVFLSTDPDDYCRACAVGKHCTKISIQKILKVDNDYKIYHYLGVLLNDKETSTVVNGKLIEVNEGFYMTMELLFNPSLYQFLKQQEKKACFPWK